MDHKKLSKFLSLLLRHKPEVIELDMDEFGWVNINQIIKNAKKIKGMVIKREDINEVVRTSEKQRFKIAGDRIKANQGHSIDVIHEFEKPTELPDVLYHGTATRYLDSIMEKGILSMDRHHAHLSATKETAVQVGRRHGKVIVLRVDVKAMLQTNMYDFFISENNVWLTEWVPPEFITIEGADDA